MDVVTRKQVLQGLNNYTPEVYISVLLRVSLEEYLAPSNWCSFINKDAHTTISPGLKVPSGSVHVAYDVTNIPHHSSKDEYTDEEGEASKNVLLRIEDNNVKDRY